ncbi:MAG TPA: GDP-mannose 4,6-dehydratase [Candidatus Pacearchaeota archaeon]|nr:GDP-mannose 4,6-dehydratase [Candidatus Pacearchaeota archaeon]
MRILITGGSGFIGHHLVEGVLKETDWEIIILDALTYAGNLNRLTDIEIWEKGKNRVKFIWHDLKSPISESTHKLIGSLDYVWHLAAESHVDRSLEDSIPFVMSNVVGTANLLEYVKRYQPDIKKFVTFSTDEVFGPAPINIDYKEGDVCNPSNPYSASKEGEEAISKAFAFSFGLPIMISRTMNVYGERQHAEKFIPKTVRSILNNETVIIHGLPGNISSRKWIHARNVCSALLFLMDKGELIEKKYQNDASHGVYHIVGEERDVLDLANRISKIIKNKELDPSEVEYVDFHRTRPGHDLRYSLSGEKLKNLGFEYKSSFEDSFDKTIKWMIKPENQKWLNL